MTEIRAPISEVPQSRFCPEALRSLQEGPCNFIAERKYIRVHVATPHQLELASTAAFKSYQERDS